MKKNYEHLANKLFISVFFIVLACYFGTQSKIAGYVSIHIFSEKNLDIVNKLLPERYHIHPSRSLQKHSKSTNLKDITLPYFNQPRHLVDQLASLIKELNIAFNTVNSHFQFLLGKRAIQYKNITVVIDNNHAQSWLNNSYFQYKIEDRKDEVVRFLNTFSEGMSHLAIPVLYINRPQKLDYLEFSPHLQWAIDNETTLATKVTKELSPQIDLFNVSDHFPPRDKKLFYDTDHHWRTSTLFDTFVKVAKYIEKEYTIKTSPRYLDPKSYEHITLPNLFLGASGRHIGETYNKKEDVVLLTPSFATSFEFNRPERKILRKGNFEHAFYDLHYLPPKHTFFSDNTYGAYLGEEADLTIIKNNLNHSGKKLLIINDSFGNSIAPFLALLFSETHLIDCRAFQGSLLDYAKDFEPTLVIFLLTPDVLYRQLDLLK